MGQVIETLATLDAMFSTENVQVSANDNPCDWLSVAYNEAALQILDESQNSDIDWNVANPEVIREYEQPAESINWSAMAPDQTTVEISKALLSHPMEKDGADPTDYSTLDYTEEIV